MSGVIRCSDCVLLRSLEPGDAAALARHANFGIVVDDEAAGVVSLMLGQDIERRSAEIGYWLGRAFWGRGVITQAVRATTQYAFSSLGLHRVFAVPFTHNRASLRVLEKCGYAHEGVMRRSAIKDGRVLDQHLYAAYDDVVPDA
jgi:RimJ/RimL family protein N-acetyltransferase